MANNFDVTMAFPTDRMSKINVKAIRLIRWGVSMNQICNMLQNPQQRIFGFEYLREFKLAVIGYMSLNEMLC